MLSHRNTADNTGEAAPFAAERRRRKPCHRAYALIKPLGGWNPVPPQTLDRLPSFSGRWPGVHCLPVGSAAMMEVYYMPHAPHAFRCAVIATTIFFCSWWFTNRRHRLCRCQPVMVPTCLHVAKNVEAQKYCWVKYSLGAAVLAPWSSLSLTSFRVVVTSSDILGRLLTRSMCFSPVSTRVSFKRWRSDIHFRPSRPPLGFAFAGGR